MNNIGDEEILGTHTPAHARRVFDLSKTDRTSSEWLEDLEEVNQIWINIIKLVNLWSYFNGTVFKNTELESAIDLFDSSEVICKTFYVYFSILNKKLEEINKKLKQEKYGSKYKEKYSNKFNDLLNDFCKIIGKKIEIYRNTVVIHWEKPNFIKPSDISGTTISTDYGGLDFQIYLKDGKKCTLRPLLDGKIMEEYLFRFKKILELHTSLTSQKNK